MGACVALILAGGSGSRVGADIPKQYLSIAGRPVLRRTLDVFLSHPSIDAVQVVIGENDRALYDAAIDGLDLPQPVIGGDSRQSSGRLGLAALTDRAPELVLIHDAARPFVDHRTISNVLAALETHDAVLPALPVVDTLKRSTGEPPRVSDTVDRSSIWRAQTPQGFRYPAILAAHTQAAGMELTDDTAVAEEAGIEIALVAGNEENFKITTADDLSRAEILAGTPTGEMRIGNGFDVHAFTAGEQVTLCGIQIPHTQALAGHSDADVALHAITDALLGAIAAGDIGSHFPPSDPQWGGAASHIFLTHAADLIAQKGGRISNIDLTIICEAPKIGPHRDALRASLANMLSLDIDRVSVKATTTEKLGFTGRGEGIAAQAVAAVYL